MNYSGWHLAAAVPRASKTAPRPVVVCTSGGNGELKTLQTATQLMNVWAVTSKKKKRETACLTFKLVLIFLTTALPSVLRLLVFFLLAELKLHYGKY